MAGRGGARRRAAGAVVVILALGACGTPDTDGPGPAPQSATSESAVAGEARTTPEAQPTPAAAPTPTATPGPDAVGVVPPVEAQPATAWQLAAQDVDAGGAANLTFYDPTTTPTIEGWPTAGVVAAGELWVTGVSDPDATRQWLLALDPATGAQVSLVGITRSEGAPSSCTAGLADGTLACLYGDAVEIVDPAAGTVSASLDLAAPAHTVHALEGDVLAVASDGGEMTLTRLAVTGEERWRTSVPLDEEQAWALAGSYPPVVQQSQGLALVGIGQLQLALDASSGELRLVAVGDALAPAPEDGLVASVLEDDGGSVVRWLDAGGQERAAVPGVGWRRAAASSGLVAGPLVADTGAAIVGVTPDGARAWEREADPAQLRVPMVRADGVVVLQDTAGLVEALEVADGTVRWRNDAGSAGWGALGWSALTDGDRMVVRSPQGLVGVDLDDGRPRWTVDLPYGSDQAWALHAHDGVIVWAGRQAVVALTP